MRYRPPTRPPHRLPHQRRGSPRLGDRLSEPAIIHSSWTPVRCPACAAPQKGAAMSRWWMLALLAVLLAFAPIAPVGGAAPSQPVAGSPAAMAAEAPAPAVAAAAPDAAPLDQGLETIRV